MTGRNGSSTTYSISLEPAMGGWVIWRRVWTDGDMGRGLLLWRGVYALGVGEECDGGRGCVTQPDQHFWENRKSRDLAPPRGVGEDLRGIASVIYQSIDDGVN